MTRTPPASFRLSPTTRQALAWLVAERGYRSMTEALTAAVRMLERAEHEQAERERARDAQQIPIDIGA